VVGFGNTKEIDLLRDKKMIWEAEKKKLKEEKKSSEVIFDLSKITQTCKRIIIVHKKT
jgi:hypothetical protein